MSYDIYAYPPESPIPGKSQAEAFLRSIEITPESVPETWTEEDRLRREKIVAALLESNPRLTRSDFNFEAIARRRKLTESQARERYQHAQLNSQMGDLAIQLRVWRRYVVISTPFWYRGEEAERVFAQILDYLKAIRGAAGYFAYDRQAGLAFDPIAAEPLESSRYISILEMFRKATATRSNDSDQGA